MVTPVDLPVVLSQLPNVQKVQNAAQAGPEMAQAAMAQEVIERQKQENSQVPKVVENEFDPNRKEGKKQRQESANQSNSRKKEEKEEPESDRLLDITV